MFNPFDLAKRAQDFERTAGEVLATHGSPGVRLLGALKALTRLALLFLAWGLCLLAVGATCALVFAAYRYVNDAVGVRLPIGWPLALSLVLVCAVLVMFRVLETPQQRKASQQHSGIALWRVLVVVPLIALGCLLLGANNSERVQGSVRSVQDAMGRGVQYTLCLGAFSVSQRANCLSNFPSHWIADQWRDELVVRVGELRRIADDAYTAASDPVSGYTEGLVATAIEKYEALAEVDQNLDGNTRLRLRALRMLSEGAQRDCEGCPSLRVVLAPRPFLIAEFETSVREWSACEECFRPRQLGGVAEAEPVRWITYQQIEQYLAYLRDRSGHDYALPTMEQWLVAAGAHREASGTRYSILLPAFEGEPETRRVCRIGNGLNNDALPNQNAPEGANTTCSDGYPEGRFASANPAERSHDSRYRPNAMGLFHTVGNVAEWVSTSCDGGYLVLGGGGSDSPVVENNSVILNFQDVCRPHVSGGPSRGFRVMRPL